jgi:hypothetical protein
MRDEALPRSLPSDVETLRKIVADCEATDHDLRARLADIRALRLVARQARDPRFQSAEARAHLRGELERLRSSLSRAGVISPTIRAYLDLPSPNGFPEPAEFFRVVLGRVIELHAAASRRLVEVQGGTAFQAGDPHGQDARAPSPANRPNPTKRSRRRRDLSKIQKAIVILQYRARKAGESIRVEEIAAEAGCSPQNLYDSPEFRKVLAAARNLRIRRGWKLDGVADAADDSTGRP